MKFKCGEFTLTTRELTDDERAANAHGYREGREYVAVEIRHTPSRNQIILCVGSPVLRAFGGFDHASAARSAISFANAPWCADDPKEREWMESYGDDLSYEAYGHRILGKEMRSE